MGVAPRARARKHCVLERARILHALSFKRERGRERNVGGEGQGEPEREREGGEDLSSREESSLVAADFLRKLNVARGVYRILPRGFNGTPERQSRAGILDGSCVRGR